MRKKTNRRKRGSGRVYMRGNSWNIAYYYMGKQQRERVGPIGAVTKGIAEKALTVRLADIAKGKFDLEQTKSNRNLFDLIDKYLKFAKTSQKSYKRSVVICNHLKEFFGNKSLSDITPYEIENYKQKRLTDTFRGKKIKGETINRELTVLKSMFNLALDWGIFHSYNPVKRVKFFKTGKQPDRVLSDLEFSKLHKAASPHLKPILKCAVNTGMRKSEILDLKWKDVDILNEKITVRESKNFEYRIIPINETLRQMFISMENKAEYVFTYKGEKINECYRSFKTALKKSGIEPCRLHDLRHTFATNLIMKGVDIVTVQELLGHKSLQMTRRYSHPTPENKRKAVDSLVKIEELPTGENIENTPLEIH